MSTYTSKFKELVVKFADRSKVKFHGGTAEAEGKTAQRLDDFADRHPEYGIEKVGDDEKQETPKQRLQREARELGLSDAGKVADLEARIAAKRAEDAAGDDDADDQNDDDPNDGDDADDDSEDNSSEDDENNDE